MHYGRWVRTSSTGEAARRYVRPTASLTERLAFTGWDVTAAGCWEWRGARRPTNYGVVSIGRQHLEYTHRVSYTAHIGPIPRGMAVCHRCDNPPCLNPEHLFLGSLADNNRDMREKRRHAHGDANGHARITAAQASEIRAARANGVPAKRLAEQYGVTRGYVYALACGRIRNPEGLSRQALTREALAVPQIEG